MPHPSPQPLRAVILSIGDELISGLTLDTNTAWLSHELFAAGATVISHATVGDDQAAIQRAIADHAPRCDLLIITGGIGPTPDDLTREALAGVMKEPLVEHADWLAHMQEYFAKRNRVMQPGNRKQATAPRGATILSNPIGTASGIRAQLFCDQSAAARRDFAAAQPAPGPSFAPPVACPPVQATSGPDTGRQAASGTARATPDEESQQRAASSVATSPTTAFILPGVPSEMSAMFDLHVRPWLADKITQRGGAVARSLALHTFGLGESDVAARLGELLRRRDPAEGLQVGTTAASGIVSIRAYGRGASDEEVAAKLAAVEREAREKLGDAIFGRDDETLASAVGRLLREHPRRPVLRVTESCTGGLLAKLITDVPGSSDYFDRGFVTYWNEAKTDMLGVPRELIERHGAVSEEVAAAMARGALAAAPLPEGRPGIAISITGIAGPGGGSAQKPVGTVCIGMATSELLEISAKTFHFVGDRDLIRRRSADMGLSLLRTHVALR